MLIGKVGDPKSAIEHSDAANIVIRGRDLCHELMGKMSIAEFFYFHLTGHQPTADQAYFLDMLVVALAEHGLTPSVQAARMTLAAAPEALQGAVAAGILGVGSVILGSAEQCADLLTAGLKRVNETGETPAAAALALAQEIRAARRTIPGFGHPIHHPIDPRAQRVLEAADERGVAGRHVDMLRAFPAAVEAVWLRKMPMNLTGPMAAVLLDLGVPREAVRGIPIVARTIGLIGHLYEEKQRPIGFYMSHYGAQAIEYDGG